MTLRRLIKTVNSSLEPMTGSAHSVHEVTEGIRDSASACWTLAARLH